MGGWAGGRVENASSPMNLNIIWSFWLLPFFQLSVTMDLQTPNDCLPYFPIFSIGSQKGLYRIPRGKTFVELVCIPLLDLTLKT